MIDALLSLLAELVLDAVDLFWHFGLNDYCPCERCARLSRSARKEV